MSTYVRTGVVGSPGLLARGGLIGGGLPISRPDLHFLYNLIEEVLPVVCFVLLLRCMRVRLFRQGGAASVNQTGASATAREGSR